MDLSFWDGCISPDEKEIIEQGGYGQRHTLGARPALLLIDLQCNFVGEDRPTLEQLERYPSGVGEAAWRALENTRGVIEAARRAGIPFVYTVVRGKTTVIEGHPMSWDITGGLVRSPDFMSERDPGAAIVEGFGPEASRGDIVIEKSYASAFFATPLVSYLIRRRIDSVLLVGGTMSGCVYATALDASSYGFNVGVVADCVFDRTPSSAMSSMLDIHMKYGSILELSTTRDYLETIRAAPRREALDSSRTQH